MNHLYRQRLDNFRLKCEDALSIFKKKRRDTFVQYGDTQYDDHISKLLSIVNKVNEEIRTIDAIEDTKVVDNLVEEYVVIEKSTAELQQELIDSLHCEFENLDKEIWYDENFENWKQMPPRQECDTYPLPQRLRYSNCRRVMFDHLERDWKKKTFPTLADRLEFF
jgi:hypothetical protein